MTKQKSTKRALLMSALSLLMCVSMLIGSTFAWFTDSVTSGNNIIKSGNLDIELEYWNGTDWTDVKGANDILTNTLWEPGVTEVAYLRVANAGSLVLKYQLGINILNEISGKNQAGETFKLSNYIKFGVVEGVNGQTGAYSKDDAGRAAAIAAVTDAKKISAGYTKAATMDPADELYLALVVYMPTDVGNVANHNGTDVPQIDLGINVYATQMTAENDSFNNQYDKDAWHPEMTVLNADDLKAAIANGVNAQLGADVAVDGSVYLTANLDLGGNTLSAEYVTATENVTITNGTLEMPDDTYLYAQNGVTLTLEDVVVDSDKISAYAATDGTLVLKNVVFENTATSNPIQNYGGNLVMDNVTVAQSGDANTAWYSSAVQVINKIVKNNETGKYEITAQANTTINSGTYTGKKAVMISAPGGNVTITGGTFIGSEYVIQADFAPQNYTYGGNYESVITITGGDFTGAIKKSAAAKIIISGGTFSVDPTAYLADGYKAVKVGEKYEVVADVVNYATVSTAVELQAALDNAANQNLIVLTDDIAGNVTVKQIKNLVITVNGDNHKFTGTFIVDGNSAQEGTSGVTLKNIDFVADSISADAVVRLGDGTSGSRYTANVTVDNCHFAVPGAVGIKSYTGGDINLTIKGCTTSAELHSLAQLKGVKGVQVEGCTVTSVRGINFNNSDNITVKDCNIDVQKYAIRFGSDANTTVETYAITNCTLKSANVDGDPVIELRAGATNANLTITNTTITGVKQMTGHENANVVIQ